MVKLEANVSVIRWAIVSPIKSRLPTHKILFLEVVDELGSGGHSRFWAATPAANPVDGLLAVPVGIVGLFRYIGSAFEYLFFLLQTPCHLEFKRIVPNGEIGFSGHTAVNGCMETKECRAGPFFSFQCGLV